MTNVRIIHLDWYSQRPPRFNGGPQLAFQGDHLSNMVVFDNAPSLPNYYLLVKMKLTKYGKPEELPPLMLEGPYWLIPSYYTNICQLITYQVCSITDSGDYTNYSAMFKGSILPVIKYDTGLINQEGMFDSYLNILNKRVNELIIASGDIEIDSELKDDSTNPVQNRAIKAAIGNIEDTEVELNRRLLSLPALDGDALGIVDNSSFTIGKTFDSNGLPINATNRAITDFIKSSGGDILIVVPNDNTIKVNAYMYNADKEHIAHGSYQTASRVVHNVNAVYMRFVFSYSNDTTADQNLVDSVRFYNMSAKLVTQYRGNILKLGYTSLVECVDDGYYSFSMADVPSITDLPYGAASGGTVQVFKHYANNVVYQILFIDDKTYYRLGNKPFKPLNQNTGNPIIPTWESGSINQTTGEDATSNTRIRSNGKISIGQGIKVIVPADMEISLIAYNSNGERIGTTGLQQSDFIHYPYYGETHFRMYAGYIDRRTTITISDGAKYGIFYLPISADAPMWYALGDSITQGFFSKAGASGIAGETPNNYPTYGAALMGWKMRNFGVGGSGYLKASDSLNKPNAKGQIANINFADCDICTLAYGVNDWHYNQPIGTVSDSKDLGTTMASNMKYVIEKILSDNPRCRLNILLPLNCSAYGGTFETDWGLNTELPTSGTLQHVIDVVRDVAEYYHLPIIDQSNTGIVNRYNINTVLPDGIHPSVETYKPYGERIVRQIV